MEYITHEADTFVRRIALYDRYFFANNSTQYICWYQDDSIGPNAGRLVNLDYPDYNADLIFEKAINTAWGPYVYVCIKCMEDCRPIVKGNRFECLY